MRDLNTEYPCLGSRQEGCENSQGALLPLLFLRGFGVFWVFLVTLDRVTMDFKELTAQCQTMLFQFTSPSQKSSPASNTNSDPEMVGYFWKEKNVSVLTSMLPLLYVLT